MITAASGMTESEYFCNIQWHFLMRLDNMVFVRFVPFEML